MLQSFVADPVINHQGIYRALLQAMSRPCEAWSLPPGCGPDFTSTVKSILETLLDQEVTFAIAENTNIRLCAADITRWTHAQHAPVREADFMIVDGTQSNGQILALKRGTLEMPDQGATVIYLLPEPSTAPTPTSVLVSGPGIPPPGKKAFPALGIASAELRDIREANQEFPMGIDCFFIRPDATVVGLPRSATIQEES
jgi:alpha-D-ribose 1-methylphosphonate 5-triphosphate synthase subunit PhnH